MAARGGGPRRRAPRRLRSTPTTGLTKSAPKRGAISAMFFIATAAASGSETLAESLAWKIAASGPSLVAEWYGQEHDAGLQRQLDQPHNRDNLGATRPDLTIARSSC